MGWPLCKHIVQNEDWEISWLSVNICYYVLRNRDTAHVLDGLVQERRNSITNALE